MVATTTTGIEVLRDLVALQASLLRGLEAAYGAFDLRDPASIPTAGALDTPTGVWWFRRHGTGVSFKRKNDGCIVDVHARSQEPAAFDAWRLETYLASLGRRGVKIIDQACGTSGGSLHDKIALWLKHLEEAKSIVRLNGAYVLHDAERRHDEPEENV